MKYKHYSPKARVVLYESTYNGGKDGILPVDLEATMATTNGFGHQVHDKSARKIGIIRTRRWTQAAGLPCNELKELLTHDPNEDQLDEAAYAVFEGEMSGQDGQDSTKILDIDLGQDTKGIAHGLFSALRELDRLGADVIFVDGIEDDIDIAGAVMNRLRKAASDIRA